MTENEELTKALEEAEAIKQLAEFVAEVIRAVAEVIKEVWAAIINAYPNKRVVHLAKHAKKERTRKRNINRIIKWIEREQRKPPNLCTE